jgi:hypothetical protein
MPFVKGQSGNPLGRPVGVKDRRTALRDALEGRGPELVDKAVEMALNGDTAVLVALLSKLIPRVRPESSLIEFPLSSEKPTGQAMQLLSATLSGEISPSTAAELIQAMTNAVKVREADELQERLERLEARFCAGG